ncbi:DUF6292 family protein [Streptomyces sp. MMBL 11-1]|uniref:DUF6292 family protein n=1 Tax=Streptomyces sp. MMBL 11-1 TaxID=3026420 RepID=UPI002360A0F2|nr:DUF6292 family protein [Streptomyces sp. MMBL 11-1]
MTKKRKTDKQRARELQAQHPRLSLGEALALVREGRAATRPTRAQARAALQALAGEPTLHPSWRARLRDHLVRAADPHWPSAEDCAGIGSDLHAAAGSTAQPHWPRLCVPLAMRDLPLPQVRQAMGDMARVAGETRYQDWVGVQPPQGGPDGTLSGPWSEATGRFAFAVILAFTGPLHDLLHHPYGVVPPMVDVLYGAPPVAGRRSHRSLWTYTACGLRVERLPYPRPWGTGPVYGDFSVAGSEDREQMARALLAHALGGTAPGALAACSGCQGTGWLEPLGDGHEDHLPHYYQGEATEPMMVCPCGRCRGSGLRKLPSAQFAAHFLARLTPSWSMTRSTIIQWARPRLSVVDASEPVFCAWGLQTAYVRAVVSELWLAGHQIPPEGDGWGFDNDTAGHLGAWILLPDQGPLDSGASRGRLLSWSSDRGWCVARRQSAAEPAAALLAAPLRVLCPGTLVPPPAQLVRALNESDHVVEDARWVPPRELTADAYAQVLSYHP